MNDAGILDPTLLPPPSYTKARADQVYGDAFRRAVEFAALQRIPGDVLEFGTLNGYTARKLAELMVEVGHPGRLYLFDSFEGMPDATSWVDRQSYEIRAGAWQPGTPKARIDGVERLIESSLSAMLDGRLEIVKGWYSDTLGRWPVRPPSIVHIDCDLYESCSTIIKKLNTLLQDGLILLFDDWNSGRGNVRYGERAAMFDHFRGDFEYWFSYGWHGQAFIVHR